MNAFWMSLLFGAFEMVLIFAVMWAVNNSKRGFMRLLLLVKFITYVFAVGMLLNKYSQHMVFCLCGFLVGLPMCALVLYVVRIFFLNKITNLLTRLINIVKTTIKNKKKGKVI